MGVEIRDSYRLGVQLFHEPLMLDAAQVDPWVYPEES